MEIQIEDWLSEEERRMLTALTNHNLEMEVAVLQGEGLLRGPVDPKVVEDASRDEEVLHFVMRRSIMSALLTRIAMLRAQNREAQVKLRACYKTLHEILATLRCVDGGQPVELRGDLVALRDLLDQLEENGALGR